MEDQKQHHAAELWVDGAEAYIKHAKQLLTDYKDALDQGMAPYGQPATTHRTPATASPPSNGISQPVQPVQPFSFGASAAPAPAFAWAASTAATSAPAFSFGTPALATTPQATGGEDDGDDEVEEEPAAEVQIEGAEAIEMLFSEQATLKQLDPVAKKWANKGTGRLSLRREKDSGVPYVVFTSGSGRDMHVYCCWTCVFSGYTV